MDLNVLRRFFKRVLYFRKESLFLVFLLLLSLILNGFFLFSPEKARLILRKFSTHPSVEKLARQEFSPSSSSPHFRVIKLKKKNKIYLDILFEREDGSFEQSQFLELKGNQEAYVDYWGESLSLFVMDYNGDGKLDLGVPSFDSFLRAHFEALFYNENSQKFELKKMSQAPRIKKRVQ